MILVEDCIGDDFMKGMHWRLFEERNALEMILVEEFIGDDFSRGIHWR